MSLPTDKTYFRSRLRTRTRDHLWRIAFIYIFIVRSYTKYTKKSATKLQVQKK